MITPFIVTPIALRFGWHGAFLVTGSFGILWLILWRFVAKGVDTEPQLRAALPIPWADRALWAYIAAYGLGAMPLGFILYDSSLYLHARFGWDQALLGKVLWIPPFGWEVGYFVWGAILDRFGPRFRGLMLLSLALSLPLAWMHSLPSGAWVLAEMFLATFALAGFVVLAVNFATRAFSQDHAGLLAGIGAGSWGAVIALTSPWFGRLFDHGEYAAAFRIASAFPVAGYVLWRVLSEVP
jgi:ACS family hexuronate transporter-like MFS transporter